MTGAMAEKMICITNRKKIFLSLGPASVTSEHAHYWVVWFQSQNSSYGVTRLYQVLLRIMCYVLPFTDGSCTTPLSLLQDPPAPSSMSITTLPVRASLSTLLS